MRRELKNETDHLHRDDDSELLFQLAGGRGVESLEPVDPRVVGRSAANYELVSSSAVIDELRDGEHPFKQEKIALMREVKLLPYTEQISEIENAYIARKVMPNDPRGDALHLAYASFYKCDILLSWNCRHIVNPNKAEHIEKLNAEMRLHIPRLLTPFELLNKETIE